jgi:hypothetical protein
MVRVVFNPETLEEPLKTEWLEWLTKAEAATRRAIDAWENWRGQGSIEKFKCPLEDKVWAELKDWLIEKVFHNKCAYCETREVRSPYHAEHFRPKGRVSFRAEGEKKLCKAIIYDEEGNKIEHPGYFWLAYHWANLLPSCNYCNSALGKNDQFPVKKSYIGVKRLNPGEAANLHKREIASLKRQEVYYLQPEDLNELEEPLLLNPYIDEPSDHLVFGDQGLIAPREGSEKGQISIRTYNLDAENLRVDRQIAQDNACKIYSMGFAHGENKLISQRISDAKEAIRGYIDGHNPYSAAVLDYLRLSFKNHEI